MPNGITVTDPNTSFDLEFPPPSGPFAGRMRAKEKAGAELRARQAKIEAIDRILKTLREDKSLTEEQKARLRETLLNVTAPERAVELAELRRTGMPQERAEEELIIRRGEAQEEEAAKQAAAEAELIPTQRFLSRFVPFAHLEGVPRLTEQARRLGAMEAATPLGRELAGEQAAATAAVPEAALELLKPFMAAFLPIEAGLGALAGAVSPEETALTGPEKFLRGELRGPLGQFLEKQFPEEVGKPLPLIGELLKEAAPLIEVGALAGFSGGAIRRIQRRLPPMLPPGPPASTARLQQLFRRGEVRRGERGELKLPLPGKARKPTRDIKKLAARLHGAEGLVVKASGLSSEQLRVAFEKRYPGTTLSKNLEAQPASEHATIIQYTKFLKEVAEKGKAVTEGALKQVPPTKELLLRPPPAPEPKAPAPKIDVELFKSVPGLEKTLREEFGIDPKPIKVKHLAKKGTVPEIVAGIRAYAEEMTATIAQERFRRAPPEAAPLAPKVPVPMRTREEVLAGIHNKERIGRELFGENIPSLRRKLLGQEGLARQTDKVLKRYEENLTEAFRAAVRTERTPIEARPGLVPAIKQTILEQEALFEELRKSGLPQIAEPAPLAPPKLTAPFRAELGPAKPRPLVPELEVVPPERVPGELPPLTLEDILAGKKVPEIVPGEPRVVPPELFRGERLAELSRVIEKPPKGLEQRLPEEKVTIAPEFEAAIPRRPAPPPMEVAAALESSKRRAGNAVEPKLRSTDDPSAPTTPPNEANLQRMSAQIAKKLRRQPFVDELQLAESIRPEDRPHPSDAAPPHPLIRKTVSMALRRYELLPRDSTAFKVVTLPWKALNKAETFWQQKVGDPFLDRLGVVETWLAEKTPGVGWAIRTFWEKKFNLHPAAADILERGDLAYMRGVLEADKLADPLRKSFWTEQERLALFEMMDTGKVPADPDMRVATLPAVQKIAQLGLQLKDLGRLTELQSLLQDDIKGGYLHRFYMAPFALASMRAMRLSLKRKRGTKLSPEILMERADISKDVRYEDLLQLTDPHEVTLRTITKMFADIAGELSFRELLKNEELVSTKKPAPERGLTERVPNDRQKYGSLANKWTTKEIMAEVAELNEARIGMFASIPYIGDAFRFWKETRTTLNPITTLVNPVGNVFLHWFSGGSFVEMPNRIVQAIDRLAQKDEWYERAFVNGAFRGRLPDVLLGELRSVKGRMGKLGKYDPRRGMAFMWDMMSHLRRLGRAGYRLGDDIFRMLAFEELVGKHKYSDRTAGRMARERFVDYDAIPRGIREIDAVVPFISFTWGAANTLLKGFVRYPARPAMLYGLLQLWNELVDSVWGEPTGETRPLDVRIPALKDSAGNPASFAFANIFPLGNEMVWGAGLILQAMGAGLGAIGVTSGPKLVEMGTRAAEPEFAPVSPVPFQPVQLARGNPVVKFGSSLVANKDLDTLQPIFEEGASFTENSVNLFKYIAKVWAPDWLGGRFTQNLLLEEKRRPLAGGKFAPGDIFMRGLRMKFRTLEDDVSRKVRVLEREELAPKRKAVRDVIEDMAAAREAGDMEDLASALEQLAALEPDRKKQEQAANIAEAKYLGRTGGLEAWWKSRRQDTREAMLQNEEIMGYIKKIMEREKATRK